MSITDAVTSVSTTWTEKPVVDFLAGTLAAVANLVAEVESRIQRGTLGASTTPTSTQVQNWLVAAKQELMESGRFTWNRRYAYATTAAGTYTYAMPPDYSGGVVTVINTTDGDPVTYMPPAHFDMEYPDISSLGNGDPEAFTVKGMELWIYPPTEASITLELQYQRSGSSNTATDFSFLPESERWRCCDFATAKAFAVLQQFQAAQYYEALWVASLQKAKRADSKRKWAGATSAISIFQVK